MNGIRHTSKFFLISHEKLLLNFSPLSLRICLYQKRNVRKAKGAFMNKFQANIFKEIFTFVGLYKAMLDM